MKKLLCALLMCAMVISLVACGAQQEAAAPAPAPEVKQEEPKKEEPKQEVKQEEPKKEEKKDDGQVADGTFSGTSPAFGFTSQMTCDVTFAGGKITAIDVVAESDSATGEWFASAKELLIPRIIENQSIGVEAITGATVSSNGIKSCVSKAIDAAGGKSYEWNKKVTKKTDRKKIEGYDVVVVGLGGSGIMSYCAAAYEGASVFGIEAAGKVGGDSACTYGPMALNSEYLKNLFTEGKDYINPDDVFNVWMDYVESDAKKDIIKEAVYMSGSSLDFFAENFGFEFAGRGLLGSFVIPAWTQEWCVYSPDPETGWNALGPNKTYQFTRALDKAKAMNAKNDFMTELTAEELIFDADGKVIGVKATYYDGTVYEVYGKSVILATGGFVGNSDMMIKYLGATVNTLGDTVDAGAGILMGMSAGGNTYMMGTLPMIHISQVANLIRTDDLTADQKAILSALALTTDKPVVSIEGKKLSNGDAPVDIVTAPGYKYFNVYTKEDIENIKSKGLSEKQAAANAMFITQGGTLPAAGTPVADIYDILTVGENFNDVIKADSIAELAGKIGCNESILRNSLGGVETTYYVVPCTGWAYATVGGLDVNADMNVLRADGSVIENLYAVGQDSEGVCNVDGKAYTPWGGQAQSWTFVSGQIAGSKAGKAAK